MKPGSVVIAHFVNPVEKYWGRLEALDPAGVTLRGLNVSSFDDWLAQVARAEEAELGLSTLFVPLARVERIFLDESIGSVQSYCERFRQRIGRSFDEHLAGLGPA